MDDIEEKKRESLRLVATQGAAYSLMAGAGIYFLNPFAVAIGATALQIGLLTSFSSLASSLSQFMGSRLLEHYKSRKKIITSGVLLQILAWIPIILNALYFQSPELLIIAFAVSAFAEALANPVWSSLIGDLVNEKERGRFFGKINKLWGLISLAATLSGGILLQYYPGETAMAAFTLLFIASFIARIFSLFLQRRIYEPDFVVTPDPQFKLLNFVKSIPKTSFGTFILFNSALGFALNIATPFFAIYMLRDLQFGFWKFTLISAAFNLTTFVMMTYWGKHADKFGNKSILLITALLIPIFPILWVFSTNIWYLISLQVFAGFTWAGFNLSAYSYLFDVVNPEKRVRSFSYFNMFSGIGIFLGSAIGGYLGSNIPDWIFNYFDFDSKFHLLFLMSGAVRLGVMIIYLPKLQEHRKDIEHVRERKLFVKLMAVEPTRGALLGVSGGLNQSFRYFETTGQRMMKVNKLAYKAVDKTVQDLFYNAQFNVTVAGNFVRGRMIFDVKDQDIEYRYRFRGMSELISDLKLEAIKENIPHNKLMDTLIKNVEKISKRSGKISKKKIETSKKLIESLFK